MLGFSDATGHWVTISVRPESVIALLSHRLLIGTEKYSVLFRIAKPH